MKKTSHKANRVKTSAFIMFSRKAEIKKVKKERKNNG